MRVIPSLEATSSRFTDSSIAEPDISRGEALYNAGTTYGLGAETISTVTHRKFSSLVAGNVGHAPPVWPEKVNDYWIDIGPTNRWAVMDLYRNTASVADEEITIVYTPGERIDSLGIVGLSGARTVEVTATSGGETVKTWSFNLSRRIITGWRSWFFAPFTMAPNVAITNVPPRTNLVLTIVVSGPGEVRWGGLIAGRSVYLGRTRYEAVSDTENLSKVTRDARTGEAEMDPRPSIPKNQMTAVADKALISSIVAARRETNGKVALWLWSDDVANPYFDAGLLVGFANLFKITAGDTVVITDLDLTEI